MQGYRPVPRARRDDLTGQADVSRFVSPDLLRFCPLIPKAVVTYNPAAGEVISAVGMESITDTGEGVFTVNFEHAFATADYSVLATADFQEGATNTGASVGIVSRSVGDARLEIVHDSAGQRGNASYVTAVFWGELAE